MINRQSKTPVLALLIFIAVLIVAWFGYSYVAKSIATKRIHEFLDANALQQHFAWDELKVGMGQDVTLSGLRILNEQGVVAATISQLKVAKLKDNEKRFELDFSATDVVDYELGLFELLNEWLAQPAGFSSLPSLDFALTARLDYQDETSDVAFELQLPALYAIEFNAQLNQPRSVRRALELGLYLAKAANEQSDRYGNDVPVAQIVELTGLLQRVGLKRAEVQLEERGGYARQLELLKRYNYRGTDPSRLDPKSRHDDFMAQFSQVEQMCAEREEVRQLVTNVDKGCRAFSQFVQLQKNTLTVKATANQPVTAEVIGLVMLGSVEQLAQRYGLQIEIK